MLGDTITINLGTYDAPKEITLRKINQDNYSAEYYLKEADRGHTILVRHSTEKTRVKGALVNRHNVTYTQDIFPTADYPQGQQYQSYTVIRMPTHTLDLDSRPVADAVFRFTMDRIVQILGRES